MYLLSHPPWSAYRPQNYKKIIEFPCLHVPSTCKYNYCTSLYDIVETSVFFDDLLELLAAGGFFALAPLLGNEFANESKQIHA